MRISVECNDQYIQYNAFSDSSDRKRTPKFGEARQFFFKATGASSFGEVHPDRLALVAILNTLPFCSDELRIGWPVSKRFIEATNVISRIRVIFEEGAVSPIERVASGRHALSFSGGADSTAALAVMPKITESVFMLRTESRMRTLYDSDAALESCRQLKNLGFSVHIVESDFEYLRDPIGFPTDLSVASPVILLADSRNFESIAFGTILESAFGTSGLRYRNYADSSHYRLWSTLFESVGLGYSLPLAGVSEVGSAILCRDLPIGRFHQSCIRGKWGYPCNKCWKCFRKNTLMMALDRGEILTSSVNSIRGSKEVRKNLTTQKPIKHEGVLTYSLQRATGGGKLIDALRDLVRVDSIKTEWMEHWYPLSSNLIDSSYEVYTVKRLQEYLGRMDDSQVSDLHDWENESDDDREERLNKFSKLI